MDKKALIVIIVLLIICILEGAIILLTPTQVVNVNSNSDLNLSAEEIANSINYSSTEIICPEDLNRSCTFQIITNDANLNKMITQFTSVCEFIPKEEYIDLNKDEKGIVKGYTDLNNVYHPFKLNDYNRVCDKFPKTIEEKQVEKEKLIEAAINLEVKKILSCNN